MTANRFEGGRAPARNGLVVAAVGLGVTLVLGFFEPRRALQAYHVAVVYWIGIAVGALIVNMSFQAARARWYVVGRRVVESVPLALPLLALLFVPVLLFSSHLFPWIHPERLDEELRKLAEHRQPFLNLGFFVVRAIVYFALWIGVGHLLHRWSVRQDTEADPLLTLRQRRLGAGALPFVGLAMTFAAFDWQMSLDLHLASTIFGLYYFAGSFLCAFAVIILSLNAARGEGLPGDLLNANHWHSWGKYLLTFVAFWGYMAFSQFLLIWIANIPEEVPWYLTRNRGGWAVLAVALAALQFLVPFFTLLSRAFKRDPVRLRWMAVYLLVIHYVDVYWVMIPGLRRDSGMAPNVLDAVLGIAAVLGVGGACVAFVVWRMRGRAAIPVGDPYLADSLRYDPS